MKSYTKQKLTILKDKVLIKDYSFDDINNLSAETATKFKRLYKYNVKNINL